MTIFRKTIMALTGLFICIFLIVHLGANLLLLLPEASARPMYNTYSGTLRGNPFIQVVAYVNYTCIILHVIYAIVITLKNLAQRQKKYKEFNTAQTSSWASQNMGLLGSILLAFIVIHMLNFWYRVKFLHEDQDLYQMVVDLFHQPAYVFFYTLAMIPLGFHLAHGVKSAFVSLGLYHRKFLRWVAKAGVLYAAVLSFAYAVIPLIVYFR
ncbi:succinate dehydrogenase cytochrome b subunit [Bdellovibrio sp. HCB290]|uniref:succinate dehydrogenase cytochrome b subunit n=1 Tax=Bdellovibrio sp. HCB290 TaxID=3394356 RepID=UPI0039B65CB8